MYYTKSVCTMCKSLWSSHMEYVPGVRADGTPLKERSLSKFAQFVKVHYSTVKANSSMSHKEVMEKISSLYKTMQ